MKIGTAAMTLEIDPIPADAGGSDVSAVDGGALTDASYSDSTGASSSTRYETTTDADGNVTGQIQTTTSTDANGLTYSSTNHYDAGGALIEASYSDGTGANSSTRYETTTDANGNFTGQVHFSDDSPVDGTPIDGGIVEVVPVEGNGNEAIGRPVDPQPEWRTLDGVDGISGDGSDDTPEDVIFTFDPVVYATTSVLDETPGRPVDPEPNWRGGNATAPEVESDPTPIHYAASECFHSGLDLL
jgi:hypothetical protein